jgi:hypothetical protein
MIETILKSNNQYLEVIHILMTENCRKFDCERKRFLGEFLLDLASCEEKRKEFKANIEIYENMPCMDYIPENEKLFYRNISLLVKEARKYLH